MRPVRIGTRKSPLAMWQARLVAEKLSEKNVATEIIPITSEGDINLQQPIYQLGITGVFTRSLDIALLNDQIDIAVHSLKDVPTLLPEGTELISCLERGNPHDVLIYKSETIFQKTKRIIGTGSLRRKSFWLNKFPSDEVENLRGNVQLRLQKLIDSNWDGAVFAFAGIERSGILEELNDRGLKHRTLEWMIPAPSQGIIGITAKTGFEMPDISDENTMVTAWIERQFLNILEGGCTAPIGAFGKISGDDLHFQGAVLSLDGKKIISIQESFPKNDFKNKGKELAENCLQMGAKELIDEIQKELRK